MSSLPTTSNLKCDRKTNVSFSNEPINYSSRKHEVISMPHADFSLAKNSRAESQRSELSKHRTESVLSMDYKSKMRHLNEDYDFHVNEILPETLHRGDVVSSQRMLGYIDAIMATCATFLVIPLRNLKEMKPGNSLSDHIYEIRFEFLTFFLGFFVVLTIWESVNIRSFFIKRVDDIILLMTMFSMLATTLLPFTISLEGHYPGETISIWIACFLLGIIELMELLIICYAIEHPSTLHFEIHSWVKTERRRFRNIVSINNIFNIIFITLGSVSIFFHHFLAWGFIALIVLMPLFRKFFLFVRRRTTSQTKMDKSKFFFYFSKGNISKERVVAMSDAAFAIIACLLILDITVEEFPSRGNVLKHGLKHELHHMEKDFFVYFGIFTIVSLLWYANHAVLQLFRTVNVVVLYLQKIFLAYACLSPLIGNMLTALAKKRNNDAKLSIMIASLVVLISSLSNLLILIYGLLTKEKYLHSWAVGFDKKNKHQHIYVLVKSVNLPFWSFICSLTTILPADYVFYALITCFTFLMVTFLISKMIFTKKVGKRAFLVDLASIEMNHCQNNEIETSEQPYFDENKKPKKDMRHYKRFEK